MRLLRCHFEHSEKSFLQTDKRWMCESRDEIPQVTGDLNAAFGHRPIHIRGEAATFIPNS